MSTLMIGSSGLLPEIEVPVEQRAELSLTPPAAGPTPSFVPASSFFSGSATAGPRGGDLILKVTGWNFPVDYPGQVLCQARQNRNQNLDFGWSDQFVIQVIETSRDFVRIRIRRIDGGTGGSGWGQNLRVDFLVVA